MQEHNSPLLVIVGPTASGKSDLAMKVAKVLGGEIIAADSWTVRQECNIGTAKPSLTDQAEVRHHLLDVAGPCEDFSAAVFKNLAKQAIIEIADKGKLPMLVGGTGLYINGVLFDYGFLPHADRLDRAKLNELSATELVQVAHTKGLSTEHIDARNKRRVIRLIETAGAEPTKKQLRTNTLVVGLTVDKALLQQRIQNRVQQMVSAGLEGEVRQLANIYGWDCEALKGIGYKEWQDYFCGTQTLDVTIERIVAATKQLAKRQVTWFKRNKSIHWFEDVESAYQYIVSKHYSLPLTSE